MENKHILMIEEDFEKLYKKAPNLSKIYGYIYITLKDTIPVYVGQSTVLTYSHTIHYNGSGRILKKSQHKNGRNKFFSVMLDLAETKEELDDLEVYYINRYNTLIPKFGGIGYNISSGGGGLGTYKKGQANPASSTNMSREKRVAKGKKAAETRKRLMELGKLSTKKLSESDKYNLSKKAKERWKHWKETGKYEEIIKKSIFVKNSGIYKKYQPLATKRAKEVAMKLGSPSAKMYILTDPSGNSYTVKGDLVGFCKDHNLSYPRVRRYVNKGIIPKPRNQNLTPKSIETTGWSISGGEYVRKDCKRKRNDTNL